MTLDVAQLEQFASLVAAQLDTRGNGRPPAPLLDADQAGALLNVPATWVLAEARARRIPHVRLGRYVRFRSRELLEWLDDRQPDSPRTSDRKSRQEQRQ
jgi:excisionase family DNA binding protein